MTAEIGTTYPSAAVPSTASTSRICSVAYATDEIASDESTASAVFLFRRSCSSRSEASGRPTRTRLRCLSVLGMEDGYKRRTAPLSMKFESDTVDGFIEVSAASQPEDAARSRWQHYAFHRCGCVVYILGYSGRRSPASESALRRQLTANGSVR